MKKILNLLSKIGWGIFYTVIIAVLILSIRGIAGNPNEIELNLNEWKENGPLELSPERGRFALTYSFIENQSFFYSLPIARFATPDLGYKNGHYVSLFAPGVSFLTIPGYILGKTFGYSQFGTFAVIALFAFLNFLLIRSIATFLGANKIASTIAAMVFLFATPAFAYAVNLYQHHVSTFIILSCLYILLKFKSIWSLALIWFLIPLSLTIDYPNFFMVFPIALFALGRIIPAEIKENKLILNLKLKALPLFVTALLPIIFFCWFNYSSYGDPLQLSGTVPGVRAIDEKGMPAAPQNIAPENLDKFTNPEKQEKTAVSFFKTRNLLNGMYTHVLSPDRGVVYFTPVILFGLFGIWLLYKKNQPFLSLLTAIIGANFLLYSMWGDPWGGWAFGSRYLIPAYALMAILLALVLDRFKRNLAFLMIFFVVFIYSILINVLGAVTSSKNPPQVEVLGLEKATGRPQKYTVERNIDFLMDYGSKSIGYQVWAKNYMNALTYYWLVFGLIFGVSIFLGVLLYKTPIEGVKNAKH